MILVDTGYLLALAQPRDALHQDAMVWAEVVQEPLLVTEYVLWEVVNALSRPPDRSKAATIAEQVRSEPGYRYVEASASLLEAGLRLHRSRVDKAWSLTDCISIVLMEMHGVRCALSYDQHFEQAGFEALLRRPPPPG